MPTKKINIKSRKKRKIELHGIIGTFQIPNHKLKVKYFSTNAGNRDLTSMEYELLNELKPMRERTSASEIKDLEVLFQRDLNDSRIANSLVPYLSGNTPVAFFPSILGVLMPKGFISATKAAPYPSVSKEQNNFNYNGFWSYENLQLADEEISSFAVLEIDPSLVSVLVIDGQHRSNAFRYVTNTFLKDEDGNKKNDIYSSFYNEDDIPENFESDLPVTLIWFESSDKKSIDPTLIARRLFVDVNNTSRKVNESRNILLDDYEVSSLMTRFFLTKVVKENGFTPKSFSLLQSGFDVDSDTSKGVLNPFVITSPQKIREIIRWFFFGKKDFSNSKYYRTTVSYPLFKSGFEEFFKTEIVKSNTEKKLLLKDYTKRQDFQNEFNQKAIEIFYSIFNDFILFKTHFQICNSVEEYVFTSGSSHIRESWDKVFKGGEGLYYSFKEQEILKKANLNPIKNKSLENYLVAIKDIEKKFHEKKQISYDKIDSVKINKVYESFTSIAFQVGLFMAFDEYKGHDTITTPKINSKIKNFINVLNLVKINNWVDILTEYKQAINKTTDPKDWPLFQKIILRILEVKDTTKYAYFDPKTDQLNYPEIRIYKNKIEEKLSSELLQRGIELSEFNVKKNIALINGWIDLSAKETTDIVSKCGLKMAISGKKLIDLGQKIFNKITTSGITEESENEEDE